MTTPVLDVVIPVYNEEHVLRASVTRVVAHLEEIFPYTFVVTIADNASTDATPTVAQQLSQEFNNVRHVRYQRKGRGFALRSTWLESPASVLAYLDVDLSTDLDGLFPLVAPLISGHSDVAIGSRLAKGSRVIRQPHREVISRCYNLILRLAMGATFSDAQCGFKAIRADVAQQILPHVEDNTWFFDTELLLLSQAAQLRIHEVPVDWFDDPDSRVNVTGTARDDLAGCWRVHRRLAARKIPVTTLAASMGRHMPHDDLTTQAMRFLGVGALTTVLHLGLFWVFAALMGGATHWANTTALLLATVVNTAANRRWTFGVRDPHSRFRHQVQGIALMALTWGVTTSALAMVNWLMPSATLVVVVFVLTVATVAATILRFALMRWWVFTRPRDRSTGPGQLPQPAATQRPALDTTQSS